MEQDFYYNFRKMNVSDGYIVTLSVFDLSASRLLEKNGADVLLKMNNDVIAKPIPIEQATYPQYLSAWNIDPVLYFEIPQVDIEKNINDGLNRFECIWPQGNPLSSAAYFSLPHNIDYPVPDQFNITRVAGKMRPAGFVDTGASWYTVFNTLLHKELGGIDKNDAILDWGVGCGRVARYFLHENFTNFHGIDIDQLNIDWCRDNLSGGKFSRCDFDPPTQYANDTFKAIYAHSVFTHLDEKSEISWLEEINRLLSKDGIACCTIGSEFTCKLNYNAILDKNPNYLDQLNDIGRQDFGADAAGVDTGRENYYRLVAHSRKYVFDRWSDYVNIKYIIPGFADRQDAVIFSKK